MAHLRHRALPLLNHAAAPRPALPACLRTVGSARALVNTAAAAAHARGGRRSPAANAGYGDGLSLLRRRRLRDGVPGEAAFPSRILVQDDVEVIRGRLSQGDVQGRLLASRLHAGSSHPERGEASKAAAAPPSPPAGIPLEVTREIGEAVLAVKEAAQAISRASGAVLKLSKALERAAVLETEEMARALERETVRESEEVARMLKRATARSAAERAAPPPPPPPPPPQVTADPIAGSETAEPPDQLVAAESEAAAPPLSNKAMKKAAKAAKKEAKKARRQARRAGCKEAQEPEDPQGGPPVDGDGDGDGSGEGTEVARPLTTRDRNRIRKETAAAKREAGRVAAQKSREKQQAWAALRATMSRFGARKAAKKGADQKLADAAQAELEPSKWSGGSDTP